jgi:ABC-type polysaccharide/polyol phosphate export permease
MDKGMIQSIFHSRRALWSLSIAQLKSRYSGTALGFFWAVINPLLMMFAITFVFTQVFKTEKEHYSFFILSGIIPWMFFSNTLSEATISILNQQNIMRQFNFPVAVLPLASVGANFLNFLIGWIALYPLFVLFNPKILILAYLLPLIFFLQLCFVTGFGLALSVLNVFFRDIGQLLNVVLMFWFWVTPVFYSLEMVPVQFLWIYRMNPVTPYIVFYQKIIFEGAIPGPAIFVQVFMYALASVCLGMALFVKFEPGVLKKI